MQLLGRLQLHSNVFVSNLDPMVLPFMLPFGQLKLPQEPAPWTPQAAKGAKSGKRGRKVSNHVVKGGPQRSDIR